MGEFNNIQKLTLYQTQINHWLHWIKLKPIYLGKNEQINSYEILLQQIAVGIFD